MGALIYICLLFSEAEEEAEAWPGQCLTCAVHSISSQCEASKAGTEERAIHIGASMLTIICHNGTLINVCMGWEEGCV